MAKFLQAFFYGCFFLLIARSEYYGQSLQAVSDTIFTIDNLPAEGNLLENDGVPQGQSVTIDVLGSIPFGTITWNNSGDYLFTPGPYASAVSTTISYQICSNSGACSTAQILIIVQFYNDTPLAADDFFSATVGFPLTGNVSHNDVDPDFLTDPFSNINTYSVITPPVQGSVTMNSDGVFIYTPPANFTGLVSFTYANCDHCNFCDVATAYIEVSEGNAPPTVLNGEFNGFEDQILTGNLLPLAIDPEGGDITFFVASPPTIGALNVSVGGSFSYTPPANYFGQVSFNFQACDNGGVCDEGIVTLNFANTNDPPVVQNDFLTTLEDQSISGVNIATNDSDDSASLIYSLTAQPTAGAATITADGVFSYTPAADFNGFVIVNVQVCDNQNACSSQTVNITVSAVNDAPIALPFSASTNEDQSVTGVINTASDVDSPNLIYSTLSSGAGGNLSISTNGNFTFLPAINFNGVFNAQYRVCDNNSLCSIASFSITVIPVNDFPIINSETFSTPEDTPLSGSVSSNDNDVDGNTISYTANYNNLNGVFSLQSNGAFTFIPALNYSGTVSIPYTGCDASNACAQATLTLTITAVNDRPIANNINLSTNEEVAITVNLTQNSSDAEILPLSFTVFNPSNGTVSVSSSGNALFTPAINYNGPAGYSYIACDVQGLCDTAQVAITVVAINDAPVAGADVFNVIEDQAISGNLALNDSDPENSLLSFSMLNLPASGNLVINANGTFNYSPALNFNGNISATYQLCDSQNACSTGNITFVIAPLNDSPVASDGAVTINEDQPVTLNLISLVSDADNSIFTFSTLSPSIGSLSANSGVVQYQPAPNFFGTDAFQFIVCDPGGACDTAVYNIVILAVNDGPSPVNDVFGLVEDVSFSGSVASNDVNPDNATLIFSTVNQPASGSVAMQSNGNFIYTPDINVNGVFSFIYQACANGFCSNATVILNIAPTYDFPVAVTDEINTLINNAVTGSIAFNDSEPDGDPLIYSIVSSTTNGVFTLSASGAYSYTPNTGYLGNDLAVYRVCDNSNLCDTAVVNISVTNTSTPPVAVNSNVNGNEDASLNIQLNSLFSDQEGGSMDYAIVQGPQHGNIIINNGGLAIYSPQPNYYGADAFTWKVCDSGGLCDTAQVNITIVAVNDAPMNQVLNVSISEDQVGQILLVANDFEGDALIYSVATNSQLGTSVISGPSLVFTPSVNISGITTVILNVCDALNACIQDTVFINITPVNDSPFAESDTFSIHEDVVLNGNVANNDGDVEPGALLYSIVSPPASGILNFNNNGTFTYTPPANFSGSRTFSYSCCDAQGICVTANVNISILPVNDAPVINGGMITMNEGGSSIFPATLSDVDNTSSQLTLSLLQTIPGISFSFVANNIVVIPQGNFFGSATALIQLCDTSLCGSAEFNIIVNPVPDPPSAANSVITIFEDQTESVQIPAPGDPDSEVFNYYGISATGEIVVTNAGIVTYTCPLNYNGEDTITYAVCDETGLCDTAQVFVVVLPVNDVPSIGDVSSATNEDESLTLSFTATDIENNNFTWSVIENPVHGLLSLNGNEASYAPNANYFGLDSALLRVCDAPGSCSAFRLMLTVNEVNDLPQIFGESFAVYAGNQALLPISGNDFDVDNEVLTYNLWSGSEILDAAIDSNNDLTFTATLESLGQHILIYEACDSLGGCDTASVVIIILDPSPFPVAINDTIQINEDEAIVYNAFANDIANDLYSFYSLVLPGSHGLAEVSPSGVISYTPSNNYYGSDTIMVALCNTFHCDTSMIIVDVSLVNDPPFSMPVNITVFEDAEISGDASIFTSDVDLDVLTYAQLNETSLGNFILTVQGSYTFEAIQPGVDTLYYEVCDSEYCIESYFIVTVNSVINHPPMAQDTVLMGTMNAQVNIALQDIFSDEDFEVLSFSLNFSQEPNGEVLIVNDTLIYIPDFNYLGADSIQVVGCDQDLLCDTAWVHYSFVNPVPLNVDSLISFLIPEDNSLQVNLLSFLSNPENLSLTYSILNSSVTGDVNVSNEGVLNFMPALNSYGINSVEIEICEQTTGICVFTTIIIEVYPLNDAPVFVGDTLHLIEESIADALISQLYADADNDVVFANVATSAANGTVFIEQDLLAYIPIENFWGMDSAWLQFCDGDTCIFSWLFFEVDFVNDAPLVEDESFQVLMNGQLTGDLGANDVELDNEVLYYSPLEIDSVGGFFSMSDNGDFTFIADSGFTGVFTVHYFACDPCNVCDEAILTIVVASEKEFNTPPVIDATPYFACAELIYQIDLTGIVSDSEQSFQDFSINLNAPNFGSAFYDFESQSIYYQSADTGVAEIILEVCDNALVSLCTTDTLMVYVSGSIHAAITEGDIQNAICSGDNNGFIQIGQMNGGMPFNLLWDNGATVNNLNNLSAGTYCVDIDVLESCVIDTSYCFEITEPDPLLYSILDSAYVDSLSGFVVSIEISGGTEPYGEVVWSGPNGFVDTGWSIDNLTDPGTYMFSVTDANGCLLLDSIVLDPAGINYFSDARKIFPNPVSSNLNFTGFGICTIEIRDAGGKICKIIYASGSTCVIALDDLSSGLYIARITSEVGTESFRFIKE
jgi:hypothetical protein